MASKYEEEGNLDNVCGLDLIPDYYRKKYGREMTEKERNLLQSIKDAITGKHPDYLKALEKEKNMHTPAPEESDADRAADQ